MPLNKKFDGPRQVRPEELKPLLKFLDSVFPDIVARYPHVYALAAQNPSWFHIVKCREEFASHIGIYPLKIMLPRGEITVGGIGAVATAKKFRNQGLMAAQLEYATAWMKAQGMPLSILWGDRRRYARHGWEPAGQQFHFSLFQDSLPLLKSFRQPVKELKDPRPLAPLLASLHRKTRLGALPDTRTFHHLLLRKGKRNFVAGGSGNPSAYATGSVTGKGDKAVWKLEAMAGSVEGLFSIFRHLLAQGASVKGSSPLVQRTGWTGFYDMAESWSCSITGLGQIKILDLKKTLEAYGLGSLAPGLKALGLTPLEMTRLLFGPVGPRALLPPGPFRDRLSAVLPLELHLWPAESV